MYPNSCRITGRNVAMSCSMACGNVLCYRKYTFHPTGQFHQLKFLNYCEKKSENFFPTRDI